MPSISERLAEAGQLEKEGQPEDAAAIYQKLFDGDAANEQLFARLLVLYRKLKQYRKELAVINTAIAAFGEKEKTAQQKWIAKHPKAAGAGRSMLKQLERTGESVFGANPVVDRLLRRKAVVSKRLGISTGSKKKKAVPKKVAPKEVPLKKAIPKKIIPKKAAPKKVTSKPAAAPVAKLHPSLFIITLRYLVPLEKIDAAMPQHMAYLDKQYKQGSFLISGRQVPRTGGIIIARGKDRDAIERITKEDPFLKKKLATADIVEFSASQIAKGGRSWLQGL